MIKREVLNNTDFSDVVTGEKMSPVHPGEMLKREFLVPLDMTAYALAKAIHVPINRMSMLVKGERNITTDTALRLARYFGNSVQFWLNAQMYYDVETARVEGLDKIEPMEAY